VPESNEMLAKIMAYGMEGKGANGVGKLTVCIHTFGDQILS